MRYHKRASQKTLPWGKYIRPLVWMWVLGTWISLPLVRLEAKVVHDPQAAATQKVDNTITQAQQKAQIAAQTATTAAKMSQKQIIHYSEQIQKWTNHIHEITLEAKKYVEAATQVLNLARQMTSLNGILRLFVYQFDGAEALLKFFHDVADLYLSIRQWTSYFYEGIDLFFQGRSLLNEFRSLGRQLKDPSTFVALWERFALDTGAVQVHQDRALLRALCYQKAQLTKLLQLYKNDSARLVEVQQKLKRLEIEIENAQKRPTFQKNDPGQVAHPPIPQQSPGIPTQAPVAGPHVLPTRDRTNAGEDRLLRLLTENKALEAEITRALIQHLNEVHKLTLPVVDNLAAADYEMLRQLWFESSIMDDWLRNEVNGAMLFSHLIGFTMLDNPAPGQGTFWENYIPE